MSDKILTCMRGLNLEDICKPEQQDSFIKRILGVADDYDLELNVNDWNTVIKFESKCISISVPVIHNDVETHKVSQVSDLDKGITQGELLYLIARQLEPMTGDEAEQWFHTFDGLQQVSPGVFKVEYFIDI